jgi:hypothetical protein
MQAHHFGVAPSAKLSFSTPFAFYEGEAGGGGGEAPKTFTQADLDAAVAGLKAKNQELIGTTKALKARADVIGDRTPEEVQADLEFAKLTREQKAKAEGDFEGLKKQMIDQHTAELTKVTGRTKKVEGKLYDVLARREVEAAITAAGGNPKILAPHILPFVKVVEQDEDFVAQVIDAKGNARIADGAGTAMTIAQLVETFKADETFGVAFAPSGTTGSGARNEGTPGGKGGVVLIPKNATPQEYRRLKDEAVKAGKEWKIAS